MGQPPTLDGGTDAQDDAKLDQLEVGTLDSWIADVYETQLGSTTYNYMLEEKLDPKDAWLMDGS